MHPPSNLDDVPVVFFRVMRLVSPELNLAHPLRLDLSSDVMPDDSPLPTPQRPSTEQIPHQAFADRILLGTYHDMSGMDGALKLPSSFGSTYLGETLHCLINVGNQSEASISQVTLKVEVATTRQKTLLFPTDPEMPPLPSLAPGACHSFAIRHDLRETGLHSITCSALFSRHDGERKYMQNHFKFPVLNPLTVRTKLRHGRGRVLMEVSLQNDTGRPLLLDSVRLDAPVHLAMETVASRSAAPQLKAASASSASGGTGKHPHSTELPYQNHLMLELRRLLASASATDTTAEEGASVVPLQEGEGLGSEAAQEAQQQQELEEEEEEEEEELQGAGPLSSYIDSLQLVAADGGIRNYVFMLRRDAQRPLASPKDSRYMGRVDIRWRRGMGELGRLQTQAIATPSSLGGLQVEMLLEGCPQVAQVGTAFQVVLRIQSCLPEPCGPFWLRYQAARQPPASGQASADTPGSAQGIPPCPVTVQGSSCRAVEQLAPQQSRQVQLQMVGLQPGLHVLRDFQLVNQRNPAELLCVLDPPEVLVV